MQADTNDRLLNIQIFAELLRRIRKICAQRFIEHLAIFDIDDGPQNWYRDFFRLAGFSRCRCRMPAGIPLQLESWNCLASREPLEWKFLTVYEKVRNWLAEGRCTKALLDSVASGEAVEVERRHFQNLLAQLENERLSEFSRLGTEFTRKNQLRSQKAGRDCVRISAVSKRSCLKPRAEVVFLGKHWYSQRTVMKGMGGLVFGVVKKRWSSRNTRSKDLWHTRRFYDRPAWVL